MTTTEQNTLTDLVGTWDMAMTVDGQVSKGTVTYTTDLGGLWLASATECEMFGQPFSGRGLECFDPAKGQYVSVWVDSMSPSPVVMEGTHDPATNERTMTGTGPGFDRLPTTYRSVTARPDADTMRLTMHIGDGPDPAFTAEYTRRK